MFIEEKFSRLGIENAPGQQSFASTAPQRGDALPGTPVDFSHGDVDAFEPTPGSFAAFSDAFEAGGRQAYTEYRGAIEIREHVAQKLGPFTGAPVDAHAGMIITPGTQGALFLAIASITARGDKVAIVQPDYFANRKLVEFCEGEVLPIQLNYKESQARAGLDLDQLESAFKAGAKSFLFSNPNNPVGVVYAREEIDDIARLAAAYDVTLIVDQLYSRLLYSGVSYTHLRARKVNPEKIVTIMGPSKTESLSGFRLGVAFGSKNLINRMEKLQAIVSLRAAGYSQAVLRTWFNEPDGWLNERIGLHQAIRDDIVRLFRSVEGVEVRTPDAGSYVFPNLPDLAITHQDFVNALHTQAGVVVTPGTEFGSNCGNGIRLNFSQDHLAAVDAVRRLAVLLDRYRP